LLIEILAKWGRSIHIVLLQEHRADQPGDAGLIREDADHIGPPFDLFVQPLPGIGAVQRGPVLEREGHVGEHLMLAVVHQGTELGPSGPELVGNVPPGLVRRLGIGLQESLPDCGGHHGVLALGHVRERIAHPVHPTALPSGAEHAGDRQAQAVVRVRDHLPGLDPGIDPLQAAPDQALQEARPERLRLRRTEAEADDFAAAFG
jgi:hypothetical protein